MAKLGDLTSLVTAMGQNQVIVIMIALCVWGWIDYINNYVGPSGVHALPLAAGRNEGGHYFRYFIPLVVILLLPTLLKPQKGLT